MKSVRIIGVHYFAATLLLASTFGALANSAATKTADPAVALRNAIHLYDTGDFEGAVAQFQAALSQALPDNQRADTLQRLAMALAQQEKLKEAEPHVAEAESLARAIGSPAVLADVLRAKTFILYHSGRVEEARAAYREAKDLRERNANAWKLASDGATWVHTPSGWRFPEAFGDLKRLRRTMLDDTGHNIVVHYRIGKAGWDTTLVSVYLAVDRGVSLEEEFRATLTELIRAYPDAKALPGSKIRIASSEGFAAGFDLPPNARGAVRRTTLSAFEKGGVLLRIRATYPSSESAVRKPAVDALTHAIVTQQR